MNTTNRITSRSAALASFGSLGLLACLIAAPVSAAPPHKASQPTSNPTGDTARTAHTEGPTAENSNATPPAKAKPRATKPTTGPLDGAARRALRASSSRQRSSLDGERIAMRTVAPAAEAPKRGKSKKKRGKKGNDTRASGEAAVDPSDRKISLDEDFLVEGRLEKPNAFFILRRSQSAYDWARLDAKFLPLVLESVQDPLF